MILLILSFKLYDACYYRVLQSSMEMNMKMHKRKHLNLVFENGWAFAESFWRSVFGNGFVRKIGVQCSKKREKTYPDA